MTAAVCHSVALMFPEKKLRMELKVLFLVKVVFGAREILCLSIVSWKTRRKLPADHPVQFTLYTPQGQLYKQMIQTNANEGFNVFKTCNEQNSPTGNWLATVKVGGATFEKRIRIETVMPNRLKVDLDFGANAMLAKMHPIQGSFLHVGFLAPLPKI